MCLDLLEFARVKCNLGLRSGGLPSYDRDSLTSSYSLLEPAEWHADLLPAGLHYCLFERPGGKGIRNAAQVRHHLLILFLSLSLFLTHD
jgi:hypothetical protein